MRSGGKGVVAVGHGSGAGVVGHTGDLDLEDEAAGDARDGAQGSAGLVKGGALLNVEFEVGGQLPWIAAGLVDAGEVAADVGQTLLDADPLVVHRIVVLSFQKAGHGAAAEEPAMESGALFVGEDDELQGMAQGVGVFGEGPGHLDGSEDAEGAVVLAAVGDRVSVGTEGDGGKGRVGARLAGDDVAGGVDADLQARLAHQAGDVLAALDVEGGVGEAHHALGSFANAAQFGQGAVEAGGVDVQGGSGHGYVLKNFSDLQVAGSGVLPAG